MTVRGRFGSGAPYASGVGGQNFRPGHWRADKPDGATPLPSGPDGPIERPDDGALTDDGRMRDPRTAANIAARENALAPRRYQPPRASEEECEICGRPGDHSHFADLGDD